MQFVKHGPDIPEHLLDAHEKGRVVFFCGAGISYPAGLPDFEGLAKKLYEHSGDRPDKTESELLEKHQDEAPGEPQRLGDLLDWSIVLASDQVHSTLRDRGGITQASGRYATFAARHPGPDA